jgi:hypothetical protein
VWLSFYSLGNYELRFLARIERDHVSVELSGTFNPRRCRPQSI